MTDEAAGPGAGRNPRRGALPIPRLVGGPLEGDALADLERSPLAVKSLLLSLDDWALLGLVGREPLLTPLEQGEVLGWSPERVRGHDGVLRRLGLVRVVDPLEIGLETEGPLLEATPDGLTAVAAREGLTLGRAAEYLGLVGGGPLHPTGSRRLLFGQVLHTRGVAGVLSDLYRSASVERARGEDDEVVLWQNAQGSARRYIRPDGYVVYCHRRELYGAFIEYDRGTMRLRDYLQKLAAYSRHLQSGRYERDHEGFPTILFLTPNVAAEERIVTAARRLRAEGWPRLPILLTHLWRRGADPEGRSGLLGPIWREVEGEPGVRRLWPRSRDDSKLSTQGLYKGVSLPSDLSTWRPDPHGGE